MKPVKWYRRDLFWIGMLAFVSLVIHILTYKGLGFHRDEFLYLALGRQLDAGYWSNPPLIGFISWLSQQLPGDALFTTRLFPAIAGAMLIFITGVLARELGGKRYAQLLACLAAMSSTLFLRGFSMLQPVPFDILFWTIILFFFLRYVNTGNPHYILWVGLFFGLGMLNKYMLVFLASGLIMAITFSRHRILWLSRYSWIAVGIALVLFSPNIIWQIRYNFPAVNHMNELMASQLVNVSRVNIVIDQVLMFFGTSIIWISGLIWLLFYRKSKTWRVFGWVYIGVLFLIILLRGKSYYTAGLYPLFIAAGAVAWERLLKNGISRTILLALVLLLNMIILPTGIPVLSENRLVDYFRWFSEKTGNETALRWEDGRAHSLPQDYSDMLGWNELGKIVMKACDSVIDKQSIFIYAENYGEAGSIEHYGASFGVENVACFSDSYLLWAPDTIPASKVAFIYVNDELGRDVDSLFASIDSIGSITNPNAREYGTSVYLCRHPRSDFRKFWADRVAQVKQVLYR
jgi:hypothetical protein